MTSISTPEKPFNFQGLPLVLQTQITHYLPKEDLADKARVSKAVKTVFENNHVWARIANAANVPITDPKNVKQEFCTKHAKEVKTANVFLLQGAGNEEFEKWIGQEKNKLLSISDPFQQRKEFIKHLQANSFDRWQCISIIFECYQSSNKYEVEAAKTLLKVGIELFPGHPDLEQVWISILEDEEMFKAYISGIKPKTPLFSIEISKAIQHNRPKFLKLLLREVEKVEDTHIDQLIKRVIYAKSEDKVEVVMWNILIEKYSHAPARQQHLQSLLDKAMRKHFEDFIKNIKY